MLFSKEILSKNTKRKVDIIKKYIHPGEHVLDFGCGDLSFAKGLQLLAEDLTITGIDVVDFGIRMKGIQFVHYNGRHVPFKNNSFDTVISYHVLHHTQDPKVYFNELLRVTKKRLLLVEPVARNRFDFPGMKFLDWFFNAWKSEKVPLPYQFLLQKQWYEIFRKDKVKVVSDVDIELMPVPSFFPIGRSRLFELIKQ